jgi:hypothetical protein
LIFKFVVTFRCIYRPKGLSWLYGSWIYYHLRNQTVPYEFWILLRWGVLDTIQSRQPLRSIYTSKSYTNELNLYIPVHAYILMISCSASLINFYDQCTCFRSVLFSGLPVSSTDITEILLKVVLNTIKPNLYFESLHKL